MVSVEKASIQDFINFYQISVLNPKFLMGIFIGSMVTYVFPPSRSKQ